MKKSAKDGRRRVYVNFDNAATTPPLKAVVAAINAFLPWYSSVHRGFGYKSQLSTGVYNRARDYITRFWGRSREEFNNFVKNATEALNMLSYRLSTREDQVILASAWNTIPTTFLAAETKTFCRLTLDGRLTWATWKKLKRTGWPWSRSAAPPMSPGSLTPADHRGDGYAITAPPSWSMRRSSYPTGCSHLGSGEVPDFLAFSGHKLYALSARCPPGPVEAFSKGIPEMIGGGTVTAVKTRIFCPSAEAGRGGDAQFDRCFAVARALNG